MTSAEPLYQSACNGLNLDVLRCLVNELGADVDQHNDNGGTLLQFAVQEGHLAVVQCLVKELGANVNKVTQDGTTVLFWQSSKITWMWLYAWSRSSAPTLIKRVMLE